MRIAQYSRMVFVVSALLASGRYASANFDSSALYPDAPDFVTGEAQLLEKLRTAEPRHKAVACKQLAIHGTKAAVPEVAKLLSDPQLSSWARIALEAIPDPACDEALIEASKSLEGDLLVGVINSIGVRRSPGALEQLAARLQQGEKNAGAASAAAIALGRIGDDPSLAALRGSFKAAPAPVLNAVAEACILCAERRLAEGNADEAANIYDELRSLELPKQRKLEATRGSIVARGAVGVPQLVEQLRSEDEDFFRIGLSTARELQSPQVTEALGQELAAASPERAVALLAAIGDRKDAAPATVAAVAGKGDTRVRVAAIAILGRQAANLPLLLELAGDDREEVANAAKAALAQLPGEGVNQALTAALAKAPPASLRTLIEVIGMRRVDAGQPLVEALRNDQADVRKAALTALGETIRSEQLPVLIKALSTDGADRTIAEQALRAAAVRMPDRDATAAQLGSALSDAPPATRAKLLEIIGAVGGPKALATIAESVKTGDGQIQDAGTRLLGEWMTADAAPVLLDLASDKKVAKFQVRALRGYLRIARQFAMEPQERVAMAQKALEAASRRDEQLLALDTLKRAPTPAALEVAVAARKLPDLQAAADETAMFIIEHLAEEGADPAPLLAKIGKKPVKIEIVKAEYGAGAAVKDVTQIVQQRVRGLPVISLGGTFNKSFGGDPAPSSPKQLTLEYRLDGKAGRTVIAENAPIVLPIPE